MLEIVVMSSSTVEHLLLAISDIPGVVEVLNACGADLPRLRKDLRDHIEETTPLLSGRNRAGSGADTRVPAGAAARGLSRAVERQKRSHGCQCPRGHLR